MNNELGLHEVTSHETDTHNSATTGQVLRDFVAGMYDEAKQHPLKLAAEAGVGAALTVGTLLVAPEVAAGIAIAGIGIAFKRPRRQWLSFRRRSGSQARFLHSGNNDWCGRSDQTHRRSKIKNHKSRHLRRY